MALQALVLLAATGMAAMALMSFGWQEDPMGQLPPDISDDPAIFQSDRLPTDKYGNIWTRRMATVGNGHLATAVYSQSVFVNCVYNGVRGNTMRARIPSRASLEVQVVSAAVQQKRFSLDVTRGVFLADLQVEDYDVQHRVFAHRFFTRAIINQVVVTPRTPNPPPVTLRIDANPGPDSDDFNMGPITSFTYGGRSQCGVTKLKEDPDLQPNGTQVCQVWTPHVQTLELSAVNNSATFMLSIDQDISNAGADWEALNLLIQEGQHEHIFATHVEEWQRLWSQAKLEFTGGSGALRLGKAANGALYYLLSSLPSTKSHSPPQPFCGLAPSTLAFGHGLGDYNGHSFWDTETWMFPSILLLHPRLTRELLLYRMRRVPAAAQLASKTGYGGLRFPWESAFTGVEVTNDCCPVVSNFEQHVTGDIAFAARQFVEATRDYLWLSTKPAGSDVTGCEFLRGMAKFWASRASFNQESGFYEINSVMPPDEDHSNVNNSAFTNVVAGYAIFFARYASCLCKESDKFPETWMDIARHLKLPYDQAKDYHPEYDGYTAGTEIKQADVVLLGFPLQYPMNSSSRQNDLNMYSSVTRPDGPAMTWAMHSIGMLDVGQVDKAAQLLLRSFQSYAQPPFQVWTEQAYPLEGAVNFATGMGGFLQALLFGYAGIRLQPEKMDINPQLPPDCTAFNITGLRYLGAQMQVYIEENRVTLTVLTANPSLPLQLTQDGKTMQLKEGEPLELPRRKMYLSTTVPSGCPLPEEVIGFKKSVSQL